MTIIYLASGVDVRDISCDTRRPADIVEAQGSDQRVGLEEEGERLTNSTYYSNK
jgi:hypothetical protein